MDFTLNEEQEMIKRNAREFLTENCPPSLVKEMELDEKGYSPVLWKQMAEMGWLGLVFPEKYGGTDGNFLDLMVLVEELGRALAPAPFFSTVILGGLLILEAGNESMRKTYLPKIAEGELVFSLALTEPEGGWEQASIKVQAVSDKDGYLISGTKLFVADAGIADYLICAARTDTSSDNGVTLFLVDARNPKIEYTRLNTMTRDKQCEVIFNQVRVTNQDIIGELNKGWDLLQKVLAYAALAKSIEMLGGMQKTLELTAEHARQRVQFGQPIGKFQAIQHHCANMLISLDSSRWLAYRTAWMMSKGLPCLKEVYLTKAWLSNAYQKLIRLGVQVHGGIGIMEEYETQLYFRHAKAAEVAFGDTDYYREKAAQQLLDL